MFERSAKEEALTNSVFHLVWMEIIGNDWNINCCKRVVSLFFVFFCKYCYYYHRSFVCAIIIVCVVRGRMYLVLAIARPPVSKPKLRVVRYN
jgi:hypothetical protein